MTAAAPDPTLAAGAYLGRDVISLGMAYMLSRCVHVAAQLKVADVLCDGARTCAELAHSTGAHEASLRRLLRTLSAFGVFSRQPDGRFAQNAASRRLVSTAPDSMHQFVLHMASRWQMHPWYELLDCVRNGQPVFEKVMGAPFFEYFQSVPEDAAAFNGTMRLITQTIAGALLEAHDFAPCARIVDVGGGTGALLCAILASHSHLNGELFELPNVVAEAGSFVRSLNLHERCALTAGNFFETVPEGGDVYLLKHVLHDWDDERAIAVLRNCARAMSDEARLLIIETVLREDEGQPVEKLIDLAMMLQTGGAERTESEYAALCRHAGLVIKRIRATRSSCSVIEVARA